MADQIGSFERGLEADLKHLATEVKTGREAPENRGISDREIIRQSLQAMAPSAAQSAPDPASNSNQTVIQNPLPDYAQNATAETKLEIEYLLDMAFHKGVATAMKEAAKSNPFVFDAFHDALTGKLHDELKKRGMVE